MESKLLNVSLDCIDLGDRARVEYELESLIESIKDVGLAQPIAIMELKEKGKYLLLCGGRRFNSVQKMGWKSIPCKIFEYMEDKRMRKLVELTENIERKDLTPAEEARLVREIHNLYTDIKGEHIAGKWDDEGHTLTATAELLGKSRRTVAREIEIADAIDEHPELEELKNKADVLSWIAKRKEAVILSEKAKRATQKAMRQDDPKSEVLKHYIVGDSLDIMQKLGEHRYNLIEIDPPYLIELRKVVVTTAKEDELLRGGKMTEEQKQEALVWLMSIFNESYRILKPNGWLLCWLAIDPWLPIFYQMLLESGFQGNMVPALWVKNNGNTRTPNIHLGNFYEPFLYMRKGDAMLAKSGSPNVFRFPVIGSKIHPNEKPIEMYMDIFRVFVNKGAKILSPFVGSGNPILAAANVEMECDGIDKNEDYFKYFVGRTQDGEPGKYKSYKM